MTVVSSETGWTRFPGAYQGQVEYASWKDFAKAIAENITHAREHGIAKRLADRSISYDDHDSLTGAKRMYGAVDGLIFPPSETSTIDRVRMAEAALRTSVLVGVPPVPYAMFWAEAENAILDAFGPSLVERVQKALDDAGHGEIVATTDSIRSALRDSYTATKKEEMSEEEFRKEETEIAARQEFSLVEATFSVLNDTSEFCKLPILPFKSVYVGVGTMVLPDENVLMLKTMHGAADPLVFDMKNRAAPDYGFKIERTVRWLELDAVLAFYEDDERTRPHVWAQFAVVFNGGTLKNEGRAEPSYTVEEAWIQVYDPDSGWMNTEWFLPWSFCSLVQAIYERRDYIIQKAIKHSARKEIVANHPKMTRAQLEGIIPERFYLVGIQSRVIRNVARRAVNKAAKSFVLTYRFDVRSHERVLIRHGKGYLPVDEMEDLQERGYYVCNPGAELPDELKTRVQCRGVHRPANGWIAIRVGTVKSHLKGPDEAPHVPAVHALQEHVDEMPMGTP